MSYRENIELWVLEAVGASGGQASIISAAKHIWDVHHGDLQNAGDHFYTWQYDMRWAAQALRDTGKLKFHKEGGRSVWRLA